MTAQSHIFLPELEIPHLLNQLDDEDVRGSDRRREWNIEDVKTLQKGIQRTVVRSTLLNTG